MTEDDVKAFITWLQEERNLEICNFTKASMLFWPVGDTDHLAKAYMEEINAKAP